MAIRQHIYAHPDALAEAVADRVVEQVRHRPASVIGLATGDTPLPVYRAIVRRCNEASAQGEPIDFSHVRFFALDEYAGLPREHPQSYWTYLWRNLLAPVGADPALVHIPNGAAPDLGEECRLYEAALRAAGGVDLWIVGMGHNGHIAFNEPGTLRDSRTRVVTLELGTREANGRFFGGAEHTPTEALTVGLATLKEHAREVLFLVSGNGKSAMLNRVLNGSYSLSVPASVLQTMHVSGYFDEAAMTHARAR